MSNAISFFASQSQIDASTSFAVKEGEYWRPANRMGGRSSMTGLTLTNSWVEKGAIPAIREDALPKTSEKFGEFLSGRSQVPLVIFSGHGTDPRNFREIDPARYLQALEAWIDWRDWSANERPAPRCEAEEDYLAKRATRDAPRACLTAGEALQGLQERSRYGTAPTLTITRTEAHAQGLWPLTWTWEIFAPGVGFAEGESEIEGREPNRFRFVKDHIVEVWDCPDFSDRNLPDWHIERVSVVSEDAIRFEWRRWRRVEGVLFRETQTTEDEESDQSWTPSGF